MRREAVSRAFLGLGAAPCLLALPSWALATQAHGDPEGLYVHQLSHLFLAFSMGLLIYWLRRRTLVRAGGWRLIQYSAAFFILWTLDAFTAHLLDEQYALVRVTRVGNWLMRIESVSDGPWLRILYYLVKLDHLFCVPALLFLYLGLKRLLREPPAEEEAAGP